MRPLSSMLALTALLLAAPAAFAGASQFELTRAVLDPLFEPSPLDPSSLFSRFLLTISVRNVGDAGVGHVYLQTHWVVSDYPDIPFEDHPHLAAGEERSYTVVIENDPTAGPFFSPGPWWECVSVRADGHPARCWSVIMGPAGPDAYPETIPHWQFLGVPMGDTE